MQMIWLDTPALYSSRKWTSKVFCSIKGLILNISGFLGLIKSQTHVFLCLNFYNLFEKDNVFLALVPCKN
jgi:hypothetical protein